MKEKKRRRLDKKREQVRRVIEENADKMFLSSDEEYDNAKFILRANEEKKKIILTNYQKRKLLEKEVKKRKARRKDKSQFIKKY